MGRVAARCISERRPDQSGRGADSGAVSRRDSREATAHQSDRRDEWAQAGTRSSRRGVRASADEPTLASSIRSASRNVPGRPFERDGRDMSKFRAIRPVPGARVAARGTRRYADPASSWCVCAGSGRDVRGECVLAAIKTNRRCESTTHTAVVRSVTSPACRARRRSHRRLLRLPTRCRPRQCASGGPSHV